LLLELQSKVTFLQRRPVVKRIAWRLVPALAMIGIFFLAAAAFFVIIGKPPLATFTDMVMFAVGDSYSLSETLVKTTPILLCALATLLPARLGLVSVGAEGQLFMGAIFGTAVMLAWRNAPMALLVPAMLAGGIAGGAIWGLVPGVLRGRLDVNETITTLLLNYVAALLVNALVYGPWKDPGNLGWPATIAFPTASLGTFFGTRVHAGLLFALVIAAVLGVVLARSRWGLELAILRGNAKVGRMIGLSFSRQAMVVMALGGAFGGLAGICETAAIQGRLQPGISVGYGLTGFLVAWLSGHNPVVAIPVSFLVGGLIAAGDSLQLFAKVPAASATILQGLLFATALAVGGVAARMRRAYG
jgi:general nucleoside transport system permease protein